MSDLVGKRALVTGAGTRIGAAIARALGAAKMRVVVHYHSSAEGAHATCDAIRAAGGEAIAHRADLYDPREARSLVTDSIARLGGLDLLVPSAASYERVPLGEVDDGHVQRAFALNLEAPLHLCLAAVPALLASRGSIVLVTDSALARPPRDYLPYLLSKAAVRQLALTLAVELAPEVRVNAVAPGAVLPPESTPPDQRSALEARTLLGRLGHAEQVAAAVVHLAGASFTTGEELIVDGGASLR